MQKITEIKIRGLRKEYIDRKENECSKEFKSLQLINALGSSDEVKVFFRISFKYLKEFLNSITNEEEKALSFSGGMLSESYFQTLREELKSIVNKEIEIIRSEALKHFAHYYKDLVINIVNENKDNIDEDINDKIEILMEKQSKKEKEGVNQLATDRSKVFVVHGRNKKANVALFTFLRSIGLRPIEWSQAVKLTGKGSPYVGEVLDAAFEHAQAIVVLMTPDDIAFLKKDYREKNDPKHEIYPTPQPRPNVLFEAGMAMGRNPDRTILLELGTIRPFSDIVGRHIIKFDNSPEKRKEIAQRLENAKCLVDITGTDWLSAGDFTEVFNEITKGDIKVYDDLSHDIVDVIKRMRSRGEVPTPREIARKLNVKEEVLFAKMKDMFNDGLITYFSGGKEPDLNTEYILGEKALESPFRL